MRAEDNTLSCACEILPTLVVLGVPEPLGTPAALANNTDAGGVFRMNVKLLSYIARSKCACDICRPHIWCPMYSVGRALAS